MTLFSVCSSLSLCICPFCPCSTHIPTLSITHTLCVQHTHSVLISTLLQVLAYNEEGAEDGSQYLVMPLMPGGDLVTALPRLNAMQRMRAIRGTLCGLEALHEAGILHFDVSSHMHGCCYHGIWAFSIFCVLWCYSACSSERRISSNDSCVTVRG